jgi:hypothetical protein
MNDWSDEETDDPVYADRRNSAQESWRRYVFDNLPVINHGLSRRPF